MPRQIPVPYDGGDPADAALSVVLREFPDASITVLHVVEPFPDTLRREQRGNRPIAGRTKRQKSPTKC